MPKDNEISFLSAIAININAMIGAGIFSVPIALGTEVGSIGIFTYVLIAVVVWFVAQEFARLIVIFPQEGSFYLYTKFWAGKSFAIITNLAYLIGLSIIMGILIRVASFSFLSNYFTSISPYILGVLMLGFVAFFNLFGLRSLKFLQYFFAVSTIASLLILTILFFAKINLKNIFPICPYGILKAFSATRSEVFSFIGFESVLAFFTLVKNPVKKIPKILTYSIVIVSILYIFFITSVFLSSPMPCLECFHVRELTLTNLLELNYPHKTWDITLLNFGIIVSIFGTLSAVLATSRQMLVFTIKKTTSVKIKYLNKIAIIVPELIALISFLVIQDRGLFYSLAVLFVSFVYIMSMIALLFMKDQWKNKRNYITVATIMATLTIFIFGLIDVIKGF